MLLGKYPDFAGLHLPMGSRWANRSADAALRLNRIGAETAEAVATSGVVLILNSRCEQPTSEYRNPLSFGKLMLREVHQTCHRSTVVCRIAAAGIVMLLMVLSYCGCEQAVGDEMSARQRFVVEVSGVVRMNSVPATTIGETSRVEFSSASDVVMSLSVIDRPASNSDAVFLLRSGRTSCLSVHRTPGRRERQTIMLSGQPCLELVDESTPVLTITSI